MSSSQQVSNWILNQVRTNGQRLTSHTLRQRFRLSFPSDINHFHRALSDLLSRGELKYSYLHGCSFLEISRDRPMRISEHVWIQPPQFALPVNSGNAGITITISPGAAFGAGEHPTTRLSLVMLEKALFHNSARKTSGISTGLDIGTGSGVLAIAMSLMGVQQVIALDTDPCAVYEAGQNAVLNHVRDNMDIRHGVLDDSIVSCDVVTANLRLPSLLSLYPSIARILQRAGKLILSGIKSAEQEALISVYARSVFDCKSTESQEGWSALLLEKRFS